MTTLNIKYMYRIKYKIQFNKIEMINIWATIRA